MALCEALELMDDRCTRLLGAELIASLARQSEDVWRGEVVVPDDAFLEEHVLGHKSFTDIAGLVVAATAANPAKTKSWMRRAANPLIDGSPSCGAGYTKGFVLGVFQAAAWLYDNCRVETELDTLLPELVPELILSRHPKAFLDERERERFGGQLAEPVKRWVLGPKNTFRQGPHLARIHKMILRLDEKMRGEQTPSFFGKFLLGKICYVAFGELAPGAQTRALSLFLHELLDPMIAE